MLCSRCGATFNPERRSLSCPHPEFDDTNGADQIKRFNLRDKHEFPLVLGLDYTDVNRVLGNVRLFPRGREFFNNRDPLPLTLSMSAFQVGEVLIPVEFAVTHPPIDPVFGDVIR